MMGAERWLPVPIKELRTTYEVSDLGRVRRCAPHPKQHQGRILTQYTSPWGTLIARLRRGSRDHHLSVAMLVAKAFLPTKRRGMIPRPHDGDRTNCGASNLFWAPAGTRAPVSGRPRKLTAAQLEEVLALRGVLSGAEVGRRYYVSRSLICRIWKRAE
jgi:hypothetical protein